MCCHMKFIGCQAHCISRYKNLRFKVLKCCANTRINRYIIVVAENRLLSPYTLKSKSLTLPLHPLTLKKSRHLMIYRKRFHLLTRYKQYQPTNGQPLSRIFTLLIFWIFLLCLYKCMNCWKFLDVLPDIHIMASLLFVNINVIPVIYAVFQRLVSKTRLMMTI